MAAKKLRYALGSVAVLRAFNWGSNPFRPYARGLGVANAASTQKQEGINAPVGQIALKIDIDRFNAFLGTLAKLLLYRGSIS